jgi:hypothetical protein
MMAACRDQEQADVEKPAIASVQLDGISSDILQMTAGSTHLLSFRVTDNREVSSVRIALSPNEAAANPCIVGTTIIENFVFDQDAAELSLPLTTSIDEEGPHTLTILVEDETGLTTEQVWHVMVNNADNPDITGTTAPAFNANDVIIMNAGENLIVDGEANDGSGLSELQVMLLELDGTLVSSSNITITSTPMAFSGASFDNAVPGSYRVVIQASDSEGNIALWGKFVNVN